MLGSPRSSLRASCWRAGGWAHVCTTRARALATKAEAAGAPSTRIEDAALALFGLLLAFCFSGAASRYEARKELLLDDVLGISELAGVASVLENPERSALQQEIRAYVEQRLVFGAMRLDDARMPQVLNEARAAHNRITALVMSAVVRKNTPTVHTPLVNALNGTIAAHDKRLYGVRNQVPGSIVLVLVVLGIYTTFTMGSLRRPQGRETAGLLRIIAYVILVALVFAVTIDLEQPRRGVMRVSQASMQELLLSLPTLGDGK